MSKLRSLVMQVMTVGDVSHAHLVVSVQSNYLSLPSDNLKLVGRHQCCSRYCLLSKCTADA